MLEQRTHERPMVASKIDINEIRIKLDQLGDHLISLLKHRSRHPRNLGVFTQEFAGGKTWFLYRLQKEQDIDSEFGRYLYPDQHPLIFNKSELTPARIVRAIPVVEGLVGVSLDISKKLIPVYQELLEQICIGGEDETSYGQTAKLDVEILLTLNERIIGLGEQVAQYKVEQNPDIVISKDKVAIKSQLVVPEREKQVIEQSIAAAQKYAIKNPLAIGDFMKRVIAITVDVEVDYILSRIS
ncbi:MAG: hypothetical protein IT292_01395 [Deltaproteobacteria bacterium]|nr:hypothetical protein [Deltaproteobacteria bacterium]